MRNPSVPFRVGFARSVHGRQASPQLCKVRILAFINCFHAIKSSTRMGVSCCEAPEDGLKHKKMVDKYCSLPKPLRAQSCSKLTID